MKKYIIYFLLLFSTFYMEASFAQDQTKSYDRVTSCIHIAAVEDGWGGRAGIRERIVAFALKNFDTLGRVTWRSEKITDFEQDSTGYFVKINTPASILNNSKEMRCTGYVERSKLEGGYDTIQTNYGGVKLSVIKLILKSSPEGAESFLIPNRIWMNLVEKSNWEDDNSVLEKFRINTSSTNTYAFVDQTVFVVIYKINSKYKKVIHYTKPATIEKEQTVWVNFEN